jgi:hypothetical protein
VNKPLTLAGLGAALAVMLGALPSAAAADGAALQAGKDLCRAAINGRHSALASLQSRAGGATSLSTAHRGAIDSTIAATDAGLDALVPAIDAATDRASLSEACHHITVDYRVYAVVVPKSVMAIGFDVDTAAATTLAAFATGADAVIAAEKAAGKDTTAAEATLAALRTESTALVAAIDGRADAVLGVEPADWNADHAVLAPYRQSLADAVGHLKTARDLAGRLRRELKA